MNLRRQAGRAMVLIGAVSMEESSDLPFKNPDLPLKNG